MYAIMFRWNYEIRAADPALGCEWKYCLIYDVGGKHLALPVDRPRDATPFEIEVQAVAVAAAVGKNQQHGEFKIQRILADNPEEKQ